MESVTFSAVSFLPHCFFFFVCFAHLLLVVVDQRTMLQVRVEFDLVDRRGRLGRLEDPVEVLGQVVGDSDGAGQARGFDLFHLGPFGLVVFFLVAEERGVDQVALWKNVRSGFFFFRRFLSCQRGRCILMTVDDNGRRKTHRST
jgi:hypothetical protein